MQENGGSKFSNLTTPNETELTDSGHGPHRATQQTEPILFPILYPSYIFFAMAVGVASNVPFNVSEEPGENFLLALQRSSSRTDIPVRPSF